MSLTEASSRSYLESLPTSTLEALIVDAAAVLAARATTSEPSGCAAAGAPAPAAAAACDNAAAKPLVLNSSTCSAAIGVGTAVPPTAATTSGLFAGTPVGKNPGNTGPAAIVTPHMDPVVDRPALTGDVASDDEFVKEVEVTAVNGWMPSMTLEVLEAIETGEEKEEQMYTQRAKLYRFRHGEWKERGVGEAKLLRDADGFVRFLLREEKTCKVMANHMVVGQPPYCDLRHNADSEKIWVWQAQDCSEGPPETDNIALKFASVELAGAFEAAFNSAKEGSANAAKTCAAKEPSASGAPPSRDLAVDLEFHFSGPVGRELVAGEAAVRATFEQPELSDSAYTAATLAAATGSDNVAAKQSASKPAEKTCTVC